MSSQVFRCGLSWTRSLRDVTLCLVCVCTEAVQICSSALIGLFPGVLVYKTSDSEEEVVPSLSKLVVFSWS